MNSLSAERLKEIACLSMLIDHIAVAFCLTSTADLVTRQFLGRLAFPIFCFVLVEGFRYSHNRRNYCLRLLLVACISEVPYNLLFGRSILYPESQNTMFTLLAGLLLLMLLDRIRSRSMNNVLSVLLQILCVAAVGAVAHLLRLDYGYAGILCILAIWYFRTVLPSPASTAALWGCAGLNVPAFDLPGAFLAAIPIYYYDGSMGNRKLKYFFYLFYPLHMLLLYFLSAAGVFPFIL